jgi:predicted Zn-dependent peptidase
MKRLKYIAFLSLAIFSAKFDDVAAQKSPGSRIIDSLSRAEMELTIPEVGREVERVVLDNGIILYLYENHRLPLFNLTTYIRCGAVLDPAEKAGLSGIVGAAMRTGGSKTISGDSLNIIMEYMGGSLETWIGDERGEVSLRALSKDIDTALTLFADLLRNPAFPKDKIDLAKSDVKNNIKRRNDNPHNILGIYFNNIIYGDHPSGRVLEWATVKGLTREDLIDYHNRFFVPNNIMMAISGDFNKTGLIEKMKELFGDWPRSSAPLPRYPEVKYEFHPGVYQVWKDINQAFLRIGHLGIKRDNPDRYAIHLLNYILGGGSFTSRLTSRVRSDEGLAYHVRSAFPIGERDYGAFAINCQTKGATAYKATSIILEEIEKIRRDGVKAEELDDARDAVLNNLVFDFDSAHKIATALLSLEYDGYPLDYYKGYFDRYRAVTADDIKRVAKEYLKPESLTYIIVGKPETFEKRFDEFGPVTNIRLTEPVVD